MQLSIFFSFVSLCYFCTFFISLYFILFFSIHIQHLQTNRYHCNETQVRRGCTYRDISITSRLCRTIFACISSQYQMRFVDVMFPHCSLEGILYIRTYILPKFRLSISCSCINCIQHSAVTPQWSTIKGYPFCITDKRWQNKHKKPWSYIQIKLFTKPLCIMFLLHLSLFFSTIPFTLMFSIDSTTMTKLVYIINVTVFN